ncbi:MAG: hypothetical protein ACO1N0_20255 [Fluviicola sp.]
MKKLKLIGLLGLGFMTIQSCSQSETCECTDMATELLKGESEKNYDGTFGKKYMEEHKAESDKCEKMFKKMGTDKATVEKLQAEMKGCSGYDDYKEQSIKQLEHMKKQVPAEFAKQIDEQIKKLKED